MSAGKCRKLTRDVRTERRWPAIPRAADSLTTRQIRAKEAHGHETSNTKPDRSDPGRHGYQIKRRQFSNVPGVTVQDRFGTLTLEVQQPERLCPATDKNGEGITDATDHLTGYRTRRRGSFERQRNQTVVDQFGTLQLDISSPERLLVPTGKDGVAQQPPLDHFQCYRVKRSRGAARFQRRTVAIANQIETTSVQLTSPFRLCTPANKNGEDPTAPSHPDALLCYKTRGERFGDELHTITNQFSSNQSVEVVSRKEFCVPAQLNPGVTSTTTTSTPSTTATTSTAPTTSTTVASTTSTTATSTTVTVSTSSTTSTTLYGSPSRAFVELPPSLLD